MQRMNPIEDSIPPEEGRDALGGDPGAAGGARASGDRASGDECGDRRDPDGLALEGRASEGLAAEGLASDEAVPPSEAATSEEPTRTHAVSAGAEADPELRDAWRDWLVAAQDGDAEAYDRLLRSILPELEAFVIARLRDPTAAEDVVQNVLLSLHRALHTYRPERPVEPWLFAIARNAVVDAQRKRRVRRGRELPLESTPEPAMEPASPPALGLSRELIQALEAIPASQREAVELVKLQELSVAEAARRAGTTASALKVRAHRGYRALRRLLERGGD